MAKDYYNILGLSRSASEADIKKAYRDLSKKWHPDKHKGDKAAETKFKEINEAYEVLGHKKRREQYDQFGTTGGPGGGQGYGGFDFSGFQSGNMGGFGDIFESFFGGGASQRQRSDRGADMQVRISISLSDVVAGATKTISIEKRAVCETCNGTGSADKKTQTCSACSGTGNITRTVQSFFGTIQQSVQCQQCRGSGQTFTSPCRDCSGEGRRRKKVTISLSIPAGIEDGQTLRVAGQGEAGAHGAAAGDLYVEIHVEPDSRFVREGTSIKSSIKISVLDAIFGTEVSVPTLHGNVTLKVPAGTQPQHVLRMKGKGLPQLSSSRMGDHYVTVTVEIPTKLSREERRILEEWKRSEG